MNDFGMKVKDFLSTSAKFVGKTANTAAKATKYKMDELTSLSKRRDLISELGAKVFELSANGVELPAELADLLNQIKLLDCELEALRADHAAQKAAAAEKHAAEKAARAAEKAAAKASCAVEEGNAPVQVEIPEEESVVPTIDVESDEETASEDEENEVPTLNV